MSTTESAVHLGGWFAWAGLFTVAAFAVSWLSAAYTDTPVAAIVGALSATALAIFALALRTAARLPLARMLTAVLAAVMVAVAASYLFAVVGGWVYFQGVGALRSGRYVEARTLFAQHERSYHLPGLQVAPGIRVVGAGLVWDLTVREQTMLADYALRKGERSEALRRYGEALNAARDTGDSETANVLSDACEYLRSTGVK